MNDLSSLSDCTLSIRLFSRENKRKRVVISLEKRKEKENGESERSTVELVCPLQTIRIRRPYVVWCYSAEQ